MDEVQITDLRAPQRDEREQAIYDFGVSLEVDLQPSSIVAEAEQRAGAHGFDDPTLLDRLRAQVDAVEEDVGLTGLGRLIVRQRLVGCLMARLRFDAYVDAHPDALDVDLEPPVIVVGLPRSGTTNLVNLLAADVRFRSLPWWECIEPIPVQGEGPGADGLDPRYLRCLAGYEAANEAAPLTKLMHDRHPSTIEEECELIDLDLCSYTLEWHARVPRWRDHYLQLDQRAHYEFLRRELQVLSHLRGPRRWVLKTPQHLEQLGPLLHTFPDATVVLTLRDPVAVIQSAITMLAYGDRLRRHEVEPDALARYWIDRSEGLLTTFVHDLHLIPTGQRVDVEFTQFMADEMGTIEQIYKVAGIDLDEAAHTAITGHAAAHPRGKHGQVRYDLRRDFHLEPADVRARFGFYLDEFPQIVSEVH